MGKRIQTLFMTAIMAAILGIKPRTLQLWHKAGCPRVKHGLWDATEVIPWWAANIYNAGTCADDSPSSDLQKARTLYWKSKAEKMSIDVEKSRGTLMPKNDVITEWTERVVNVCSGLEALADRLPPLLAGVSPKGMISIVRGEVRALREGFAREGRYCPTPGKLAKLLDDYHKTERKSDGE